MNYILFDDNSRNTLLPLTYTRPVADIRVGILTIREKWEKRLNVKTSSLTENYLSEKYPCQFTDGATETVWINGAVIPNNGVVEEIKQLKQGQVLVHNGMVIAANTGDKKNFDYNRYTQVQSQSQTKKLTHTWDIFSMNGEALQQDFDLITAGRKSMPLSASNKVIKPENIFVEEGAKVECAILNASTGVIYVGKDAEIMEGTIVRGSLALCEHATLKLGTKIYGPTTLGPHCKVGGEVNNSVFLGYSNKAHDGFLGNSVIGEWCNLGADTNNSNLKNNYSEVKVWSYADEKYIGTGLTFCGLIMGDHSKCGINTMFNTGTVVGVNANIFGAGFPEKHIPSFSWGGAGGFATYRLEDAFEVASRVYERRSLVFDETEKSVMGAVFENTAKHRT